MSLFWLNLMMGASVTLVVAAASPLIAAFYGDGRLVGLVLIASSVLFHHGTRSAAACPGREGPEVRYAVSH